MSEGQTIDTANNQDCPKAQHLVSSKEEVDHLAAELADIYINYLNIDISQEKKKYEDSIEECLAHLEEVCSALDGYKQNSEEVTRFVSTVISKNEHLEKLYEQIDAMEQYIFETNRLLDQLDSAMKEIENHRGSGGDKIKQIFGMIPRLAYVPRLGLFDSLSGLIEETPPSLVDGDSGSENQLAPIGDILSRISHIEASISVATSSVNMRLRGRKAEPVPELNDSMATLTSSESPEQVDGSWQELL